MTNDRREWILRKMSNYHNYDGVMDVLGDTAKNQMYLASLDVAKGNVGAAFDRVLLAIEPR